MQIKHLTFAVVLVHFSSLSGAETCLPVPTECQRGIPGSTWRDCGHYQNRCNLGLCVGKPRHVCCHLNEGRETTGTGQPWEYCIVDPSMGQPYTPPGSFQPYGPGIGGKGGKHGGKRGGKHPSV
ncbi:putative transporter [Venturia nashicola]|nr:putative transporter [Venturia nashicola]